MSHAVRSFYEVPAAGWNRLDLASAVAVNANSSLSGSASDDGAGIQAAIVGGAARTDPFDSYHLKWRVFDAAGQLITDFTKDWSIEFLVIERTAPGLSSDFAIDIGMVNESADSGTIDGAWGGIRYTGATRNVRVGGLSNGSTGGITEGTASASIRQAFLDIPRLNAQNNNDTICTGLDVNGAYIGATKVSNNSTGGGAGWASGTKVPYLFASWHRTAATAGTETGKFDLYYRLTPPGAVKV